MTPVWHGYYAAVLSDPMRFRVPIPSQGTERTLLKLRNVAGEVRSRTLKNTRKKKILVEFLQ